jgi:oxygen-dependent protoporphyrinogen oxidase
LEHNLQGFGLLATSRAKKEVLGVLWDSSIFDDRAEKNKKLLRAMIGGQRSPLLALKNEDELLKLAINGVKETMGIETKPDMFYIKKWEKGIPNYKVGHLANVDKIFKSLENIEGIYLNSNAYYGVGLNDCISNAKKCAKEVLGSEGMKAEE